MGFESEKNSILEAVSEYKESVEKIAVFLPWLEKKSGQNLMESFVPNNCATAMPIPRYDSNLLDFIKTLENSGRINKNYDYVYKRYKIYNEDDEISLTHRANITDMEMLFAILSKYVILGRTKGLIWKSGVENGVYFEVVKKMKELIEFWSMPM